MGQRQDPWLDRDPVYLRMGRTARARARRYHEGVSAAIPHGAWQLMRDAIERGHLTGGKRFLEKL